MVTLKQVAASAGVSIKTVSRIVNGDAAVNDKTRASVQRHISALNYVPNHAARLMRSGESSVFGLMTDAIATTPYSVDIVRGAQAALKASHQTLLIASTDGDPTREAELWRMFRAHGVAGVVYAAMFHRPHRIGKPPFSNSIVLANCYAPDNGTPSIVPDDESGGYTQARYLLERGHRSIAFVSLIESIRATQLRGRGIRRAFKEAAVEFDGALQVSGYIGKVGQEISIVHEVARKILNRKKRPTAIICGNDTVALQIYAVAAELGLSVPQDLSLIGFDDLKLISESLYPKLTTVALPYFDIGRLAVENMNTARAPGKALRQLVPCPLVERHSCRPLS